MIKIIGSVVIILISLFVSKYFKSRLHIKDHHLWVFSKERDKRFIFIDLFLFIVYVIGAIIASDIIFPYLLLGFFMLLFVNQGMEAWLLRREDRNYYYHFTGAIAMVTMIFLFLFDDVL